MNIVVATKKSGEDIVLESIDSNYDNLKDIIQGYLEVVHIDNELIFLCDEEGKLKNKPVNFIYNNDMIVGNVIFVRVKNGEFESITKTQFEKICTMFK